MNAYQQLNDYLVDVGVEVKIERNTTFERKDFPEGSRHYNVTVSNQSGDSFLRVYSQGPAIEDEPSILAVLHSLVLDYDCGELSFDDFCSDLGYNADSREDYKLWRSAKLINVEMFNILGNDVIDRIRDILSDY
ncbi:hypothetical protein [Bacteriophage Phi NF-1]|uniref:Uncharacterized protein n=1 Tax=Bacteriophage Phi NF-1 TaxID=2900273 RepID=A0A976MFZ2_9CAUD|nr:hypothetical protein [Bacteriophage Phi NF-1]